MKITMIEVEATAEDLKSSRTVSDALSMALGRIADRLCGYSEVVEDAENDDKGGEA